MKKTTRNRTKSAMPSDASLSTKAQQVHLEVEAAKQRLRLAKEQLKRARKLHKEAKRIAKRARKKSAAIRKELKRTVKKATPKPKLPASSRRRAKKGRNVTHPAAKTSPVASTSHSKKVVTAAKRPKTSRRKPRAQSSLPKTTMEPMTPEIIEVPAIPTAPTSEEN